MTTHTENALSNLLLEFDPKWEGYFFTYYNAGKLTYAYKNKDQEFVEISREKVFDFPKTKFIALMVNKEHIEKASKILGQILYVKDLDKMFVCLKSGWNEITQEEIDKIPRFNGNGEEILAVSDEEMNILKVIPNINRVYNKDLNRIFERKNNKWTDLENIF